MDVEACAWPASRIGEAMEELARRAGLRPLPTGGMTAPDAAARADSPDLAPWIKWAGERLGLEASAVDTDMANYRDLLSGAAPAILCFTDGERIGFYLLLKGDGARVRLIGPDLRVRTCRTEALHHAMVAPYEAHLENETGRLLDRCGFRNGARARVRRHLMRARLGDLRVGGCWMLRPRVTGLLASQLRGSNWYAGLAAVLGLLVFVYGLEVVGWGLIGNVTLNGRLDLGWLAGWGVMLASLVPLRALSGWVEQTFALKTSQILKQRSFAGALRLDVDTFKQQGVGQLLGRVIESQALEALALNGGMGVLIGAVEMGFAMWVLLLGAGGLWHVFLLLAWLAVSVAMSANFVREVKAWTLERLKVTQDLIESMLGHRTRLVQEPRRRRDYQEDAASKAYFEASYRMDQAITPLLGIAPSGWLIVALLGLAPSLLGGSASLPALAVSLGGILLANRALSSLVGGLTTAARAGVAWGQVAPLFRSANLPHEVKPYLSQADLRPAAAAARPGKLVDANRLTYRHAAHLPPVLNGVDLSVQHGERILLCGESGGGKSTLASILVGLRQPDSGLLLLNGLDRHTLGEAWHTLACEAPQFHENHILSGPIGLNLLMGRSWPASARDLSDAEEVCHDLGLSKLLARMPGGLTQMVGETGWQLSHGEQSRVFLARALLQDAPLTVLDESFAALDPENLKLCVAAAFKHARTLVVIAHP